MGKPNEPVTRSGSQEAQGIAIAPDRADERPQRPCKEVQGKNKRKLAEY